MPMPFRVRPFRVLPFRLCAVRRRRREAWTSDAGATRAAAVMVARAIFLNMVCLLSRSGWFVPSSCPTRCFLRRARRRARGAVLPGAHLRTGVPVHLAPGEPWPHRKANQFGSLWGGAIPRQLQRRVDMLRAGEAAATQDRRDAQNQEPERDHLEPPGLLAEAYSEMRSVQLESSTGPSIRT